MNDLKKLKKKLEKTVHDIGHKVEDAVENVVKGVVAPIKVPIDILGGKPIGDAVKEAASSIVGAMAGAADLAIVQATLAQKIQSQVVGGLAGDKAADILADSNRWINPLPPETQVAVLKSVQLFIETGDLNALHPLAILAAGEISSARNQLVGIAQPIEAAVVDAMPEEIRSIASACSYLTIANVPGALNLPKFAIKHLDEANAITLIDIIVFENGPTIDTPAGRNLWAHELWHAKQYADMGPMKFAAKYIGEELGFHPIGDTLNALEKEAIAFGCRHFFVENPGYGTTCPAVLGAV